ncbi:MAG: hypothetical protein U5L11_07230 [Arhodomonas sp.]|nr:hypothetical protein [Arhodomonas sp.]
MWPLYVEARGQDWSASHLQDHQKAMQVPGQNRKRSRAAHGGRAAATRCAMMGVLRPTSRPSA